MNIARTRTALLAALALLACSSVVYAQCRPNDCINVRDECRASGGSHCELAYYDCLYANGCDIP
ncbi:hypothetical protein LC55x_2241 [Lysobacter capsici]|jgi:hypothetical protein|uniref:Uncharacterized protein n=1 Tax=Lysobacter capsici AZ78 TaxID=1444315 RepID=A0A108U699_9GAMM|nr:hypothetical protein [Lysobacter capsici]ALN85510.1 hypothetical protein LC55x_2241 [Lysobacter capsici]KWS03339.1 hypothetical protein AZ78_0885 [Lysobacter capsici AZ78]WND82659.1 hypothetical protein RJ610_10060 [Lysobacter capsici]WND87856.1 hypothetical protein RJ609_10065 [Lysobacter capsici]